MLTNDRFNFFVSLLISPQSHFVSSNLKVRLEGFSKKVFIYTHTHTHARTHTRFDASNTEALRRIVGVRWYEYVTNALILTRTGQPPLTTTICKLRLSGFGHICCLQSNGHQHFGLHHRRCPPLRWADQITKDTQLSRSAAVLATHDRPSWRSLVRDATCPTTQAT